MTNPTPQGQVPEALRSIQRFEVVDCIDDKHVPAVIPKPHGPWVRYEDHIAALAAGQAAAAQQSGAKLNYSVLYVYANQHGIDYNSLCVAVREASAQPAAQQGVAYAALPESFLEIPDVQDESGINAYYSREVVLECIDAALASHGQAPAQTADSQLLQFYGVTTDAELIAAQAAHIEKLQAKLTKTPSFAPQRVREG